MVKKKTTPKKKQQHNNTKPIILSILGTILVIALGFMIYSLTQSSPEQTNTTIVQDNNESLQEKAEEILTPEFELSQIEQELLTAINNQREAYRRPLYNLNENLSEITQEYHEISIEEGEAAAKVQVGTLSQRVENLEGEFISLRENTYEVNKEGINNGAQLLDEIRVSGLYEDQFTGIAISIIETDTTYSIIIDIYEEGEEE